MVDSSRVSEVADFIAERHEGGMPISQEAILNSLMQRDGVSCSNTTYQRAYALFRQRQSHPLLQDEGVLKQVGIAAISRLITHLPDQAAFTEMGEIAVAERVRRQRLESDIREFAASFGEVKKELAALLAYLDGKGAKKASMVVSRAVDAVVSLEEYANSIES